MNYIEEKVEEFKKTFPNLPEPVVAWYHQDLEEVDRRAREEERERIGKVVTQIMQDDIDEGLEALKERMRALARTQT